MGRFDASRMRVSQGSRASRVVQTLRTVFSAVRVTENASFMRAVRILRDVQWTITTTLPSGSKIWFGGWKPIATNFVHG